MSHFIKILPEDTMYNTDKDIIVYTIFGIGIAVFFWLFWVKPYNDRLNSALDCMHKMGDMSERGYALCTN